MKRTIAILGGLALAGTAMGQGFGVTAPGGPGTVADATVSCPWDCGSPQDKVIDTIDFLALLAQWGQVGTSCDFGLGNPGVDTPDFLKLLANWGPCPPPPNDECDGKIVIDRILNDDVIIVDFDMETATPSPEIPKCEDVFAKDIWYCLVNASNVGKNVTITTTLPLTIEVNDGCTCPPGPLVTCGFNGQVPQTFMPPGAQWKIRLVNANGIPNGQLKGQLIIENKPPPPDDLNFYFTEADFLAAMALKGKVSKFDWDFKPHAIGPNNVVTLDDPLDINTHGLNVIDPWTDAAGIDLWPTDVDNVQFLSNRTPQQVPPLPFGIGGLAFASTGFGGLDNNALVSNPGGPDHTSLTIVSGPPAGDNHTAFMLELVNPIGGTVQDLRINTYDKDGNNLGTFSLTLVGLEKFFIGIQAKETTIGWIDIFSANDQTPFEAISRVSAWRFDDPGQVNLFTDINQFQQALDDAGKVTKLFWNFKPDHLQPGTPCFPIQDPLDMFTHFNNAPGIWDGPLGNLWPPEVDNVQFVSNMNPQGPVVPGAGMLYCKGPTPDFEYDNNGLIAEGILGIETSLSIWSGPPAGPEDNHTAFMLELVSAPQPGQPPMIPIYHITVFDKNELEMGKFVIAAQTFFQKLQVGILTKDPAITIGRIDIWDETGGQEGISAIAAYFQGVPQQDCPAGTRIDFGVTPDDFGNSNACPGPTPISTEYVFNNDIVFGVAVDNFNPPGVEIQDDGACNPSCRSNGVPAWTGDWWCQFRIGLAPGIPGPLAGVTSFSAQLCFIDAPPGTVLMEGYNNNRVLVATAFNTVNGTETLTLVAPPGDLIAYVRVASSDPARAAGLSIDCLNYPDPIPRQTGPTIEPCPPGDCPPDQFPEWCLYEITAIIKDPNGLCDNRGLFPGALICVARCPFPGDLKPCMPDGQPNVIFQSVDNGCVVRAQSISRCELCPPGFPKWRRIN